jgi:YbbR domain-containing protein
MPSALWLWGKNVVDANASPVSVNISSQSSEVSVNISSQSSEVSVNIFSQGSERNIKDSLSQALVRQILKEYFIEGYLQS